MICGCPLTSNISVLSRRNLLQRAASGLALPILGVPWLTACGGGDQATIEIIAPTPRLASVDNFRDMAGANDATAYRNSNGQKLRRGVFYRSNAMTPSAADKATLEALGITAVYDLRTSTEKAKLPDVVPAGAVYRHINVLGVDNAAAPRVTSMAEMIAAIDLESAATVILPSYLEGMAQLFTSMALTSGPQVFHCTAGKDRTGWAAVLLLGIAGVSRDVIMTDYLLSNTYSAASIQASYDRLKAANGQAFADMYRPALGVQESFLMASINQAEKLYGSMDGYVEKGLRLDKATVATLRAKLLV